MSCEWLTFATPIRTPASSSALVLQGEGREDDQVDPVRGGTRRCASSACPSVCLSVWAMGVGWCGLPCVLTKRAPDQTEAAQTYPLLAPLLPQPLPQTTLTHQAYRFAQAVTLIYSMQLPFSYPQPATFCHPSATPQIPAVPQLPVQTFLTCHLHQHPPLSPEIIFGFGLAASRCTRKTRNV